MVEIARTMRRRPSGNSGWDLELPSAIRQFAESEAGPEAQRSLVGTGEDGSPVAELRIETEDAEALITAWGGAAADADTIDLEGTPAVVAVVDDRVAITWSRPDGAEVLFGYLGSRDDAERIARSIEPVDVATWLASSQPPDPTQDGCQSLFC